MRTLIKGRKLIDGKAAIEGAAILIDGDRITAVGDPLLDISSLQRVNTVFKDGQAVAKQGEVMI